MVKFYSTHCPKCTILERKMKAKNIEYTEINDTKLMISLGLRMAPALQIDDGKLMNFGEAVKWVEAQ